MSEAIVVAPTPPLSKVEKQLLAEALRRAEEARDSMEDALVGFGRWVLVNVFDDDAKAALEGKRDNVVWHELLRRAGGPTLQLSRKLLYVGVQIAAHDKRIADEAWRKLEAGRKEILLPLGDESLMRKAAQHVLAMKLTHRSTREYVRSLLSSQSKKKPQVRLTHAGLVSRLKRVRELALPARTQKLVELLANAKKSERNEVLREATALLEFAKRLTKLARENGE